MYYFASDIHLGLQIGSDPENRERLLVQWLDEVSKDADAIFLVGDIFDFWYEYRYVVPKGFTRLLGKLSELTDSHLRLKADFENYKKRNQVAVADAYNEGMAYALGEFLKVMDNMERALAAAKEAENEAIAGGIQLSMDSFLKAFEKHGFARIESDGAEFDPNLHNAVMQTPTEDDALRGKVAQTLQVGYLLHGKVLRHSMVAVYA